MAGRYFGKYSGIVKDNRDADKLGQLQLSVPVLFPADELVKARPALPYGFFFVPENDSKVWVEFEGGDPGLPLWTGLQYVGSEWAAEAAVDPPQRRVIRTASGHLLEFHDKSGEEKISIQEAAHGHTITLNRSGIKIVDGANQHEIVIDNQGVKVKTAAGAKLELGAALTSVDGGSGVVEVKGSLIKLSASAALPILRMTDQGIGNLGAPVVITGPGNPKVLA